MTNGMSANIHNSISALWVRLQRDGEIWLLVIGMAVWYGQALQGGVFADVPIFARSSAAMLDGYFYGNPTHAHAPIARYAMAVSQAVFGTTTFAVKLPSVVFAVATVVLTYRLGRTVFTRRAGFAAAVLLAGNAMFTRWTATGYLDITLAFVVTALTYAILQWDSAQVDSRRHTGIIGALLVIVPATMLQGAVFALAGGIAVVYSAVRRTMDPNQLQHVGKGLVVGMSLVLVVVYTPFLFSPHPEYFGGYQLPKIVQFIFAIPFVSNVIYAFGESVAQNFGHISAGHSIEVAGQTYQNPPFWSFAYWMVTGSGLLAAVGFAGLAGLSIVRKPRSRTIIAAISTVVPFIVVSSVSVKNPNYILPLFPVLLVWAAGSLELLLVQGIKRIRRRETARRLVTGILAISIVLSAAAVAPITVGPVQSDSSIDDASKLVSNYAVDRDAPVQVVTATPLPFRWYFGDKQTKSYSFEAESPRPYDLDDDGDSDIVLSGGYQNETIQRHVLSDLRNGSLCLVIEIPGQTSSPISSHLDNATLVDEFPRTTKGDYVAIYRFPENCPPSE